MENPGCGDSESDRARADGGSDGSSFRLLCREQGAGLVVMEMISAKAITFHNYKTAELMKSDPKERPVSLQLFGHEPEVMARPPR